MPTHSIGAGKVMVSVPMPLELRQALGRYAFLQDKSVAAVIRAAVEKALKGALVLFVSFIGIVGSNTEALPAWLRPADDGSSMVRSVRNARGSRRRDEVAGLLDHLVDGEGNL